MAQTLSWWGSELPASGNAESCRSRQPWCSAPGLPSSLSSRPSGSPAPCQAVSSACLLRFRAGPALRTPRSPLRGHAPSSGPAALCRSRGRVPWPGPLLHSRPRRRWASRLARGPCLKRSALRFTRSLSGPASSCSPCLLLLEFLSPAPHSFRKRSSMRLNSRSSHGVRPLDV